MAFVQAGIFGSVMFMSGTAYSETQHCRWGEWSTGSLQKPMHSPPQVDRIWLWVCDNKIPIYPMFYLLKGG